MKLEKLTYLIEAIKHNRTLRQKISRSSHALFFLLYFSEYITSLTADFQREMFKLTETKNKDLCVLSAFRGSAKSTIFSTSLPIWKIISGQSHFVVIASQTQHQSRQHMMNIKKPLESNKLLRNDLGPFNEENTEWGFTSGLIFDQYDAKLMVVSTEQSIRGLRYKQYRPDLIILDDIEDLNSTRTKESRDKIFNWFTSEILPLGTTETKVFVLGNFLHEQSLVGRLMAQINDGSRTGIAKKYPLIDDQGICLWPGRFPDKESIEKFKKKIGDDITWNREYLLKIVAREDQIVKPEDIHYYDNFPSESHKGCVGHGVDLAISTSESADYTAIVSAQAYFIGEIGKIFIHPSPINAHLDFHGTMGKIMEIRHKYGIWHTFFVEDVSYQKSAIQEMQRSGLNVRPMKPFGDKAARLQVAANYIKNGTVLFPRKGCEELLNQVLNFGMESHDDLVDSLGYVILGLIDNGLKMPKVHRLV
jgi:predicted phage terminase large subunit-like protein